MRTRWAIPLGIAGAILVAFALVVTFATDPVVRSAVARGASDALKVPATLGGAHLSFRGELSLQDFAAANPSGFREPTALAIGRIDGALESFASVLGEELVLGHLTIDNPELTVEFGKGGTNLSILRNSLASGGSDSAASKKFRIRKFVLKGASVRFASDSIEGGSRKIVLPPLELDDVGGKSGWATTSEVLHILLESMARRALWEGGGFLPKDLSESFGRELKAVRASAKVQEALKNLEPSPRKIKQQDQK